MKTTSKMKATGSRTKNAADVRLRPAARTPGSGLNVQLTVAERDDIDAAKTRIRDVVVVARDLSEHSHDSSLYTLFEVIGDAVEVIDNMFRVADARRKDGAR